MSDNKTLPEERGPWVRKTYEKVYENPWIEVSHEEVITPGKTEGIYGFVHFKGQAVGIIPVDSQGNTRLVGQFRYTLNEFSWEIPMGGGKRGDDPLIAAKRELQEETGLSGGKWQQLLKLHTSNSITDEQGFVFLVTDLVEGEQRLESTEADLQVKTLPLEEAIAMALDGRITDAISVAGLLAVKQQGLGLGLGLER